MTVNKKGFTLMELLIVVIMISGLVAIVYPSYISSIERARASEAVTMLGAIKAAQEKNYIMYDEYATSFREIRDFTPALPTPEDGEENFFNLDSNSFRTEYFRYTMTEQNGIPCVMAERVNPNGQAAGKGYSFIANYKDDFISCDYTTTDGDKICSSLTDRSKIGSSYRIY